MRLEGKITSPRHMNSDQRLEDNVSLSVIAQLFSNLPVGVLEQYKWLCSIQCDNNNAKSSGSEPHVNTPDQHTVRWHKVSSNAAKN